MGGSGKPKESIGGRGDTGKSSLLRGMERTFAEPSVSSPSSFIWIWIPREDLDTTRSLDGPEELAARRLGEAEAVGSERVDMRLEAYGSGTVRLPERNRPSKSETLDTHKVGGRRREGGAREGSKKRKRNS